MNDKPQLTYDSNVGVEMLVKMLQREVAENYPGRKLVNYSIHEDYSNAKRTIVGVLESV